MLHKYASLSRTDLNYFLDLFFVQRRGQIACQSHCIKKILRTTYEELYYPVYSYHNTYRLYKRAAKQLLAANK